MSDIMGSSSTTTYGSAFSINPVVSTEPLKTPAGLLVTRAVETKAGWVSHIIIDKEIVWESKPYAKGDEDSFSSPEKDAIKAANQRVVDVLRKLFQ